MVNVHRIYSTVVMAIADREKLSVRVKRDFEGRIQTRTCHRALAVTHRVSCETYRADRSQAENARMILSRGWPGLRTT
jgi:hypothetical protein